MAKSVFNFFQDEEVSFVIPVAGQQGLFVIGLGTTLASLRWNLHENIYKVVKLAIVDHDKVGNRWNDAKADVNGYLWAGEYMIRYQFSLPCVLKFVSNL